MRQFLKVTESISVTLIESDTLPDADPLRLKLVTDDPTSRKRFLEWLDGWNKRESKKYGTIEVVPDSEKSDVALVIHRGNESLAATMWPMISEFLVIEKPAGLEVIWKTAYPDLTGLIYVDGEPVRHFRTLVEKELEKRFKVRRKSLQK